MKKSRYKYYIGYKTDSGYVPLYLGDDPNYEKLCREDIHPLKVIDLFTTSFQSFTDLNNYLVNGKVISRPEALILLEYNGRDYSPLANGIAFEPESSYFDRNKLEKRISHHCKNSYFFKRITDHFQKIIAKIDNKDIYGLNKIIGELKRAYNYAVTCIYNHYRGLTSKIKIRNGQAEALLKKQIDGLVEHDGKENYRELHDLAMFLVDVDEEKEIKDRFVRYLEKSPQIYPSFLLWSKRYKKHNVPQAIHLAEYLIMMEPNVYDAAFKKFKQSNRGPREIFIREPIPMTDEELETFMYNRTNDEFLTSEEVSQMNNPDERGTFKM